MNKWIQGLEVFPHCGGMCKLIWINGFAQKVSFSKVKTVTGARVMPRVLSLFYIITGAW